MATAQTFTFLVNDLIDDLSTLMLDDQWTNNGKARNQFVEELQSCKNFCDLNLVFHKIKKTVRINSIEASETEKKRNEIIFDSFQEMLTPLLEKELASKTESDDGSDDESDDESEDECESDDESEEDDYESDDPNDPDFKIESDDESDDESDEDNIPVHSKIPFIPINRKSEKTETTKKSETKEDKTVLKTLEISNDELLELLSGSENDNNLIQKLMGIAMAVKKEPEIDELGPAVQLFKDHFREAGQQHDDSELIQMRMFGVTLVTLKELPQIPEYKNVNKNALECFNWVLKEHKCENVLDWFKYMIRNLESDDAHKVLDMFSDVYKLLVHFKLVDESSNTVEKAHVYIHSRNAQSPELREAMNNDEYLLKMIELYKLMSNLH